MRSHILSGLLALFVASISANGHAQDAAPPPPPAQLRVKVGAWIDLHVISSQVMCDDTTLVKVETLENALRLHGLKEGKTLCAIWQAGVRHLYQVVVSAK